MDSFGRSDHTMYLKSQHVNNCVHICMYLYSGLEQNAVHVYKGNRTGHAYTLHLYNHEWHIVNNLYLYTCAHTRTHTHHTHPHTHLHTHVHNTHHIHTHTHTHTHTLLTCKLHGHQIIWNVTTTIKLYTHHNIGKTCIYNDYWQITLSAKYHPHDIDYSHTQLLIM